MLQGFGSSRRIERTASVRSLARAVKRPGFFCWDKAMCLGTTVPISGEACLRVRGLRRFFGLLVLSCQAGWQSSSSFEALRWSSRRARKFSWQLDRHSKQERKLLLHKPAPAELMACFSNIPEWPYSCRTQSVVALFRLLVLGDRRERPGEAMADQSLSRSARAD